jgi:Fe-S-cluster-containing dehydrogenase component
VEPPNDPARIDPAVVSRAFNGLADRPKGPVLIAAPSIRYLDGRGANKSWLNEIPDPLTQIAWQTPVLMHPETAADLKVTEGDVVSLQGAGETLAAPVYDWAGSRPGGDGHGRGAGTHRSGSLCPQPRQQPKPGLTMWDFPLTLPIPEGYDHKRDFYPPHDHDGYRWAMVVDLDRCIGCNACAAACYAENNIGVVGVERILEGREMAWLQIQRYEDKDNRARVTFLPMMCQQCDNAPCESVCPVYAPHHNKEGINNQIYNRCIGTRFCSQNCPYKVRRFNWYTWEWPKPLNLQLNPDVTVRAKGSWKSAPSASSASRRPTTGQE